MRRKLRTILVAVMLLSLVAGGLGTAAAQDPASCGCDTCEVGNDDEASDDEAGDDEASDDEAGDDEASDDEADDDEASDDGAGEDEASNDDDDLVDVDDTLNDNNINVLGITNQESPVQIQL